jgi:peptidoglycan/xylan/chitin deacetylase (PgdA/CDA1 family)
VTRVLKALALVLAVVAGGLAVLLHAPPPRPIAFPGGKQFAFSIIDDTDLATLERVRPIYDLLDRYGVHTTKTVWVLPSQGSRHPADAGDSLSTPAYRDYMLDLQRRGFEIALHGVRGGSSQRADIAHGLEEFKTILGHYPRMHVNHSLNRDNLYWGGARWSFGPFAWLYDRTNARDFSGQVPGSPYFWGDLAKAHIRYVNQFTYGDINLLKVNPHFPYALPDKPFVNYWFPTADGDNLDRFEELLAPENLDRLQAEHGICLVYAHLGAGSFNQKGAVNPRFEARIKDVAARNGWFAPASDILDYLQQQKGWEADMGYKERLRLEAAFFSGRLFRGNTRHKS